MRTEQLQLLRDSPREEPPFSCSGVFSENYVTRRLRQADGFAVNWETEKLCDVEGDGPFDEF